MPTIDLVGRVFGRRTVLAGAGTAASGGAAWLCRCECGAENVVEGRHLLAGKSLSCGCWAVDKNRAARTTHGGRKHVLYDCWENMRQRCLISHHPRWMSYGGRGVGICERWTDFRLFALDMGSRPTPNHSLERLDNDGDYTPDNCVWATRRQQARNTRTNRRITVDGVTKSLAGWVESSGVSRGALTGRLNRGWAPALAVTVPTRQGVKEASA